MNCSEADALIHAYADGELAGADRDAYEQHLLECDPCSHAGRLQSRFKAAVRGHLPPRRVPEHLQRRIAEALAAQPAIRRRFIWHTYPRLVPAAAAAVALFALLGVARQGRSSLVMEQAMRTYQAALPLDVLGPNCASIVDWFRGKVDFAVPPLANVGTCKGGRLVNVQDRFGAYLLYQVPGGHRLGMMVFAVDDDEVLDGARRRMVGGRAVYFGRSRGASTAAYRDPDGLTYVLTSDLDEDALGGFLEAAVLRR